MQPSDLAKGPATPNVQEDPKKRPDVSPDIMASTKDWWVKTDNQVQRSNALWEYREANKTLFPARFTPTDPRRGQTPYELRSGKDDRRVRTPYIYRASLQITAMTVPDDYHFEFEADEQVKPPADPATGIPPTDPTADPVQMQFADSTSVIMRKLLKEAKFVRKLQAQVQDSGCYPAAILKGSFRRDYQSQTLNPNPGDKDETDAIARLTSMVKQYAAKSFDQNDAQYAQLLDMMTSLKSKARIKRWFGLDIQLVPFDAFGISEEATDLVNIYDAPFMWHDALITGEEILAKYPFKAAAAEGGESFGVLVDELNAAVPWDTTNSSTDPNARNRSSRNKQLTAPKATPLNTVSTSQQSGVDPKKRQYVVREIWCKRDRTVYTVIRGLDHFIDKYVPQKTSQRWYPFSVQAPNRVPTEVYGASDVELKRDIQGRIHRKRTDEEKARFLSLPRGIYNRAAGTDEKEMTKLQDIPPGQLRGINFGTTQMKIDDMVQWWDYKYNPESFNTDKDEQDMDQMGALPVQSLGTTGSAKFATEVSVASTGATVATNFRKANLQRESEDFITSLTEVVLQELSGDEARMIGGPFTLWPDLYDEVEAAQIVSDAQMRAMQAVAPQVLAGMVQQMQMGIQPDEQALQHAMEAQAAPVWQAEMVTKYGSLEPFTRESLFQRLKLKISSSFSSRMDKQANLQMLGALGGSIMQIAQAAQGTQTPFNMRPILMYHADLMGGSTLVDEAFPAVSPMQVAQQMAHLAMQQVTAAAPPGQAGPPGASSPVAQGPKDPNAQGGEGSKVDPAGQAENGLASAPNPMPG